jgi:hypothetical protein
MAADALFRLGRSLLIRAELTGVVRRAPIDLTEVVAGTINAEYGNATDDKHSVWMRGAGAAHRPRYRIWHRPQASAP